MYKRIFTRHRGGKTKRLFSIIEDFFHHGVCKPDDLRFLENVSQQDLEFLKGHKIITTVAYIFNSCGYRPSEPLAFKLRRYNTYINEVRRVCEILDREGIEYIVIKTLGAIPRDIADIDLLLGSKEYKSIAEDLLRKAGYKQRKKGLEQDLWSIKVNDVIVDIELTTEIAAAGYVYYNKRIVLRNAIINDNGVRVPHPVDHILIISSHNVMKDLYITLSNLLDIMITIEKNNIPVSRLCEYASSLGHTIPLLLHLKLLEHISGKSFLRDSNDLRSSFIKILARDASRQIMLERPYIRPSVMAMVLSYFDNVNVKLKHEELENVIKQVLSLVRGKGINALVHYLMGLPPEYKGIWE